MQDLCCLQQPLVLLEDQGDILLVRVYGLDQHIDVGVEASTINEVVEVEEDVIG